MASSGGAPDIRNVNTLRKSDKSKGDCVIRPKNAIKSSLKNVGDNMDGETHVWSIPLYTLFRFKDYLYKEMDWE